MRLLLITETVPYPLDGGGRIKTYHTLRALVREHEVHCHGFVRDDAQRRSTSAPLQAVCESVTLHLVERSVAREAYYLGRSLLTGVPFTVTRHYEPAVMAALAADCRARRVEAVYCDHLSMFEYARRLGVPIIHDAHNVEYRVVQRHAASLAPFDPRRAVLAREWRRLQAYEADMYSRSRLVFAVSEVDAREISRLAGRPVPIVAVPIAVDARAIDPVTRLGDQPQVLFVGALDWPPNAEGVAFFLREVWPRVLSRRPDARFVVVGRGESALVARWKGAPAVSFTGRVPDLVPYFAGSRVTVVPLLAGSGMRVKILDAFARGVPVVSTRIGIEGIDALPGVHALVEDLPAAIATAVVRLLDDPRLGESLARAARDLVVDRYDRQVVERLQLAALRKLA